MKSQSNMTGVPMLYVRQLPEPKKTEMNLIVETLLATFVPILLSLIYANFLTPMLTVVVDEKERKIKESLKMVGLKDSVFWMSWFIVYAVIILFPSIVGTLVINLAVFTNNKQFIIVFVLIYLYCLSIIMFAFVLTTIFNKVKTATLVGAVVTNVVAILFIVPERVLHPSSPANWIFGLLSPTAFAMGVKSVFFLFI